MFNDTPSTFLLIVISVVEIFFIRKPCELLKGVDLRLIAQQVVLHHWATHAASDIAEYWVLWCSL